MWNDIDVMYVKNMMSIRRIGNTVISVNKAVVPAINLVFKRSLSYSGKEFNDEFKQRAPVILMSHEQYKQSLNVNDTFSTSEYAITTKTDVIKGYDFIEDRYGVRSFIADVTIPNSATLERYGNNVAFKSNSFRVTHNRAFWNTNMGKEIINHRLNNGGNISKELIEQYIRQTGNIQTINTVPIIKTLLDNKLFKLAHDLIAANKNVLSVHDMSAIVGHETFVKATTGKNNSITNTVENVYLAYISFIYPPFLPMYLCHLYNQKYNSNV